MKDIAEFGSLMDLFLFLWEWDFRIQERYTRMEILEIYTTKDMQGYGTGDTIKLNITSK